MVTQRFLSQLNYVQKMSDTLFRAGRNCHIVVSNDGRHIYLLAAMWCKYRQNQQVVYFSSTREAYKHALDLGMGVTDTLYG